MCMCVRYSECVIPNYICKEIEVYLEGNGAHIDMPVVSQLSNTEREKYG